MPPSRHPALSRDSDTVARRTFVALAVATGYVLMLGFLWLIREVLVWLFIALVFTLALAPAVRWFSRRGLPRVLAVLLTMVLAFGIIGGLVAAAFSPVITQGDDLIRDLPVLVDDISRSDIVKDLEERFNLSSRAEQVANSAPAIVTGSNEAVVNAVRNTFNAVAAVGIILTFTFFLLLQGQDAWQTLLSLLRLATRTRVDRSGRLIAKAVGGYVTGNLLLSVIIGLFTYVLLSLLGVPYALPLAVAAGVLDLIPFVGAITAGLLLTLVALSVSPFTALIVLVVFSLYQQVEGNVLQPVIYSRTVHLSELYVLLATVIGGAIGGIIGILLAIPAAAVVQIIVVELLAKTTPGRRAGLTSSETA